MNEINIILDSNIEFDESLSVLKNDKKILFKDINTHMNILNFNKNTYASNELISSKLDDLLYLDNYIDFISDLDITKDNTTESFENDVLHKLDNKSKDSIFSKKIIIKKMLELINPIIDDVDRISTVNAINTNKSAKIVNKNNLILNYPITSKYINPKLNIKELRTYIIPALNYFNIIGLYNNNIRFNVPYTLNEFSLELNNNFKIYTDNINKTNDLNTLQNYTLYVKELNYSNSSVFSIDSVNIEALIKLYKLTLARFELYNNNTEINYNKTELHNKYPIKLPKDNEIINKDIITYNKFLNNKIGDYLSDTASKDNIISLNNIYNSFNNDGLLFLYEKIKLYTLDNDNVKKTISLIFNQKKNLLEYNNNVIKLNNKVLVNNKLEHSAKKKFPNLFNVNHKENIFNKFNPFDINKMPKKYKEIILLDYKKNEDYIKNQTYNKCKHKDILKNFYKDNNKYQHFQDLLKYINKDRINEETSRDRHSTHIYKCNVCMYNLICPHIVDYYILTFSKHNNSKNDNKADYINQKILNKYMSNAPIDMIYYCKICGEELGKSADIEQNSEFKDNVRTNTLEYTDETSVYIQNSVSYIVYTYISFNSIGVQINKRQIIKYIIEIISFYINNIEKKLRKGKNYDNEKIINILKFNIIIFTYASIIFIMNKYSNLVFNKIKNNTRGRGVIYNETSITQAPNSSSEIDVVGPSQLNKFSNIIVTSNRNKGILDPNVIKIKGAKTNTNNIKDNFRNAYDLIINTNHLLLTKLDYNKNSDVVKNILVKTYTIINTAGELELDTKKSNNLELLLNSSIYQYYYNVVNIYPVYKSDSKNMPKNIGFMLNYPDEYISTTFNKQIKYTDYKNIIGNIDIDKKPNYLFENIDVPKFIKNINKDITIDNLNTVNSFSEYKYYSFLLFLYFIKNRLYELPIYEFIDLSENSNLLHLNISDSLYVDKLKKTIKDDFVQYKDIVSTYISKLFLIKEFEILLIKNNIRYNQYPYSSIKLNNSRYFYHKRFENINLNIYICKNDSKLHNYSIYIYNLDNKEYRFSKKDIEKNLDIVNNKKTKFIGYQCNKCKLDKNNIISNSNFNNSDIYENINDSKDIIKFYNIYRYKCPLAEFHIFDVNNDNTCKLCKITASDILSHNITIFNKFKKNYIEYVNLIVKDNNIAINKTITNNKKMLDIDVIKEYKNSIGESTDIDKYINMINDLNLNDLFVYVSKISNISIKYFQILGLTEGMKYSDIELIEPSYDTIDGRFLKISNYIRTLSIYSSILINIDKCSKYYDFDLLEIINDIKLMNISNKLTLVTNINLIDILNYIKMVGNNNEPQESNKYIIEFGLKILFNKIKDINILNESLDNKIDKYVKYIIKKVFLSDELYTLYNYAELKQMFTENSSSYEEFNIDGDDNDDDGEDAGLFEYNDIDVDFGDVDD